MALVLIYMQLEKNIMDNGQMINKKDLENKHGKMEVDIWVII